MAKLSKNNKFNHYHKITKEQKIVDFGTGSFIADKKRIKLLEALNKCGLETRTHCYGNGTEYSFVGVILDNVSLEIRKVYERDADRTKYNGKMELLISWKRKD